jgi:hypothetical protein
MNSKFGRFQLALGIEWEYDSLRLHLPPPKRCFCGEGGLRLRTALRGSKVFKPAGYGGRRPLDIYKGFV